MTPAEYEREIDRLAQEIQRQGDEIATLRAHLHAIADHHEEEMLDAEDTNLARYHKERRDAALLPLLPQNKPLPF